MISCLIKDNGNPILTNENGSIISYSYKKRSCYAASLFLLFYERAETEKIAKKPQHGQTSRAEKQGPSATETNIKHKNSESTSRTGGMVYESKNVLYG